MQRLSIRAYAVKHKLSIYNVMKMVRSGKLETEILDEEGKEVTYILVDEAKEAEIQKQIIPAKEANRRSLEEEVSLLKAEVAMLKKEVAALQRERD